MFHLGRRDISRQCCGGEGSRSLHRTMGPLPEEASDRGVDDDEDEAIKREAEDEAEPDGTLSLFPDKAGHVPPTTTGLVVLTSPANRRQCRLSECSALQFHFHNECGTKSTAHSSLLNLQTASSSARPLAHI